MSILNNEPATMIADIFEDINTKLLIVMPYNDIEDQEACEQSLMRVISYVRKNHPQLPFTVFTYHPMSFSAEDNEKLQELVKTHQVGVTVCCEKVRVFEFLKNPNLQGNLIIF